METPPEIPVIYEGSQKWITGITPKTTCDDVIHSVLINVGCPIPHEAVRNYALFENWRGVERPLKGRSRFLKLWRDWGDERDNVEVTMRKVDSSVKDDVMYGTMSRRKRGLKDFFKSKDKKKSVSKSLHNIYQDMHDVHNPDDSSILAANKDNMFCAFSCYKKKNRGLRERDTNIKTPFERPRSVAVAPPKGLSIQNPTYQDSTYMKDSVVPLKKQYSQVSHYGSKTSLKQTYVTSKRRSCYVENIEDVEPIYSTAKEPAFALENYYEKPTPRSRLPQNVHDWDYDADSGESDSDRTRVVHKEDYNDSRFKSLLNIVLSQERKIQEQFSRIKEADKQIEQYELAMHKLRTAEQGRDYLQDTYLSAHDETITEDGLRQIDELGDICDKVTHIDDKLRQQYQKLHDLSLQLETETKHLEESIHADRDVTANTTQADGPFESTRLSPKPAMDSELHSEVTSLKEQLQKSISMSLAHHEEIKKMDFNLYQCQQDVQSKQDQLQKLLGELSLSSYEKSLLSNSSSNLSHDEQSQFHRVLPRPMRSLSDLQKPTSQPVFQPGMRKSISDVRDSRTTSAFDKHLRISKEIKDMETAMRSLITPQPLYQEMGIDVGGLVKEHNRTDDVKQQVDPNGEVQRIMSLRQPVLTPIKEQDFTHSMLEYHNETVDLDALVKTGRFQNANKMFSEKDSAKDEQIVELIYDATSTHVSPLRLESEKRDVIADVSKNDSTFLPPLGLEAISNFKGKQLMPSLFNDTKDSEAMDMTESRLAPVTLCEETSVWGTPSAVEKTDLANSTRNTTISVNNTAQDNTSIWNTQDNGTDGTFTVATTRNLVLSSDESNDTQDKTSESTLCTEPSLAETTVSSPVSMCPGTELVIRQTIASTIDEEESPKMLSAVKKRLFPELCDATIEESSQEFTDITIPEVTKLESALSPCSVTSDSCESGVGSMPSDNSSWSSAFSETTV